ncbi:hypothetical protein IG631_11066 [Alternaria alternata]|nr:hypothetical protein IG631_11066 [Alternaria alternata]
MLLSVGNARLPMDLQMLQVHSSKVTLTEFQITPCPHTAGLIKVPVSRGPWHAGSVAQDVSEMLEEFVMLSHGVPDVEDVEGLGMQNGRVVLGS